MNTSRAFDVECSTNRPGDTAYAVRLDSKGGGKKVPVPSAVNLNAEMNLTPPVPCSGIHTHNIDAPLQEQHYDPRLAERASERLREIMDALPK